MCNASIQEFNIAMSFDDHCEHEYYNLNIYAETPILCVEFKDGFQFVLFEYLDCLDPTSNIERVSPGNKIFDIADSSHYSDAHSFVLERFNNFFSNASNDNDAELINQCIQKLSFVEKLKLKFRDKALPDENFKAAFFSIMHIFKEYCLYNYFQKKGIRDYDIDSEYMRFIYMKNGKMHLDRIYYDFEFWDKKADKVKY